MHPETLDILGYLGQFWVLQVGRRGGARTNFLVAATICLHHQAHEQTLLLVLRALCV